MRRLDLDGLEALARNAQDAFLAWQAKQEPALWKIAWQAEQDFRDGVDPDEVLALIALARRADLEPEEKP